LRQPTVRLWSIFFKETFRISYCELDKHVGLLRINFGTISATPNHRRGGEDGGDGSDDDDDDDGKDDEATERTWL